MINSLKYVTMLVETGFTQEQSEETINIIFDAMDKNFATKSDIKILREDTKSSFREFRLEMDSRFEKFRAEMDSRFDKVHAEMDARFDKVHAEMDSRFDKVDNEFRLLRQEMKTGFQLHFYKTVISLGLIVTFADKIKAMIFN